VLVGVAVVVGVAVDFVMTVTIVVGVGEEAGAPPSALLTPSKKPELAQTWLMSQIITPPKLEKVLAYEIMLANVLGGSYPLPAAPLSPGTPSMILTFRFFETVLAQLS